MNAVMIVFCFLLLLSFQSSQTLSHFKHSTNEVELSLGFYRSYEKLLTATSQKYWNTLLEKSQSLPSSKPSQKTYRSPRTNLQYTKNAKISLLSLLEEGQNIEYTALITEYLQALYGKLFEKFTISSIDFLHAFTEALKQQIDDLHRLDLSRLSIKDSHCQNLYYEMLKGHQEFAWDKSSDYFPSFLDIFHLSKTMQIPFHSAPTALLSCLFDPISVKNILDEERSHYEQGANILSKEEVQQLLYSPTELISLELFTFTKTKKDQNTVRVKDKKTRIQAQTNLQVKKARKATIQQAKSLT